MIKGKLEIEFENKENAKKALKAIAIEKGIKAELRTKIVGKKLVFEIKSEEISPFHALVSSIIRNLKVVKSIIK